VRGFSDLSAEELAEMSGLPIWESFLALQREYDEPFWIEGDDSLIGLVEGYMEARGFRVSRGGRYYHITGRNDKGTAVQLLAARLRADLKDVTTIAIGDAANDIPMFLNVDIPILVQRPGGGYDESVSLQVPGIRKVSEIGPAGWRAAVEDLCRTFF
jgi:mannosyl-3-phosphoglycerate phosphatase